LIPVVIHPAFAPLGMFRYGAILIDPPWSYEMYSEKGYEKSPEAHYDTMSDGNILRLPVGELASDQCILILWAVWPKLPLAMECVKRWGFKYISGGSWIKTTKDGSALKIGTGYNFRSACEPFILARIGKSQARLTNVPNVIIAPAREHSRKPDEMRHIVERLSPNQNRCELFAREQWMSNEVWGNEVAKFD
jgi:N6-adenosine-specific RNA methylase IME4